MTGTPVESQSGHPCIRATEPAWPRLAAVAAGAGAAALGAAVMVGWLTGTETLKGGVASGITIKFNAGLGFLTAGTALLLLSAPGRRPMPGALVRIAGRALACVALLLGLLTLSEHLTGINLGIDELVVSERHGERATASPGRMGPPASLCFTLLGVALLLLARRGPRRHTAAQGLGLAVCAVTSLNLVGYIYGADVLFGVARYTGISAVTAAALVVLGAGVALARPGSGPAAVLIGDDAGGLLARRLLPILIVLPIILGWLKLQFQNRYYDTPFAASMLVVTLSILLIAVTWSIAARLGRRDRQAVELTRRLEAANAALAEERGRLEDAVRARTRQLEASHERLRQAEHAAALGSLTAGLGHDVSNLLLPIRVRVEALRDEPLSEHARDDVEAIAAAADYLQRLSNSLRLLARDPGDDGRPGDSTPVSEWWNDSAPLFRAVLPATVALTHAIPRDLPGVAIPRHHLTQAVFNLVQNAADAMRPRGRGAIHVAAVGAAGGVRLTIADDGPGMSEEVRRRCFEPYFSTKRRSFATGMGLAMVRSAIERAGGAIEVRSDPGYGATFIIDLPSARGAPEQPGSHPAHPAPRALVVIKDQRRRAFLFHALRAARVEAAAAITPMHGPIGAESDAEILVIEDADGAAEIASQFLHLGPAHRRVLWLGEPTYREALNGHAARIIHAGNTFDPAAVRAAVARVTEAVAAAGAASPT